MPSLLTHIELDSLEFLSLVDEGASGDAKHRPAVVLVKRKDGGESTDDLRVPIVKVDDAQRVVYGWASVISDREGKPIIDYDGDVILAQDLEQAVHAASVLGGERRAGDMHVFKGVADVVESAVITNEKRKAAGGTLGPEGQEGWWVGLKVRDEETWTQVVAGKRPELSVKIRAKRTPIEDVSIIDRLKRYLGLGHTEKQMPEDPAQAPAAGQAPVDPTADALAASFDEVLENLTPAQQKVILAKLEMARSEPPPDKGEGDPALGAPEEPAMDEAAKQLLEKARKENEELAKRVKHMEDQNELRECIEKARKDMPHVVGMNHKELGSLLKSAKTALPKEEYDRLERSLKATSQAIATGSLFVEKGSAGGSELSPAESAIQAKIEKIREKDPTLSVAKARWIALEADPKLYDQLVKEG